MFTVQNINYTHPNGEMLFQNISFTLSANEKVSIIGKNGIGKSTLLKVITHQSTHPLFYVPQNVGVYKDLSVAKALQIHDKLHAFYEILKGNVTDYFLNNLADDWDIENRCFTALAYWHLNKDILHQPFDKLSGGEKTRCLLAGIMIHNAALILLDEPTNHLDYKHRELLYEFIQESNKAFIIVSHDKKLLNLVHKTYELTSKGLNAYGGNYDFYKEQKNIQNNAIENELRNKEKDLKKAKTIAKETLERQQKLDSKGKNQKEKQGVAKIMMNTLRNNAEKSTSKLKGVHEEKIKQLTKETHEIKNSIDAIEQMNFDFSDSLLHQGKLLIKATNLNVSFNSNLLWKTPLNFEIRSGDRIQIKGLNGSGKTTLLHLILQNIKPTNGEISLLTNNSIYIDQEYSIINKNATVYEQAQRFNLNNLQEHEVKTRLNRFLFPNNTWDKKCVFLSGGEQMRLIICCLNIYNKAPDLIILDEPTNNLDLNNMDVLVNSLLNYKGTILLISHDEAFVNDINVKETIIL